MYEIYSKAYLTIAATNSKNASGECYRVSDFRTGQTCTFQNPEGQRYEVHAREPLDHINDYEIMDKHLDSFPLLQRAWAYQERMLSPRMVHFGPNELLWECVESKTCECGHWPGYGARPHQYYPKDQPLYFEKPHLKMDNTPTEFGSLAITSPQDWKWRRIIEQYTTKKLRREEDIFPALQGVAKSMQRGFEYYAGLWKDQSLFINLLWHGQYEVTINSSRLVHFATRRPEVRDYGGRPKRWRAPTWSWASVTRPVAFTTPVRDTTEILASVADIQTEHVGDPFGQVRSGVLKLRGRCVDAMLGNKCVTHNVYGRYSPFRRSHSSGEVEAAQTVEENFPYLRFKRTGVAPMLASSSSDQTDLREFSFEPDYNLDAFFNRTVRLMEMVRWQKIKDCVKDGGFEHYYTYLVFICVDEKREVYERIGFLETRDRAEPEHFVNNGEEILMTIQ